MTTEDKLNRAKAALVAFGQSLVGLGLITDKVSLAVAAGASLLLTLYAIFDIHPPTRAA